MGAVTGRFPRSVRLLTPAAYQRVFQQSQRSSDSCFTVLCRPNGLPHPRLGMAIAKKHLKRAVDRNLVKRLIRESFRQHQQALQGVDLVVLCRQGLPIDDRPQLNNSLNRHWRRVAERCLRTDANVKGE